jgi:hypothetical protein
VVFRTCNGGTAFANPAALCSAEVPEAGIAFENRYMLSELSTKSIDFALPLSI